MRGKFDATDFAQKAVTAVSLLEEKCDINYLIDFLTGSTSEKISDEHRQLDIFGAGADTSRQDWLNLIRDFISMGYLKRNPAGNGWLQIADKGWRILKGTEKVWFSKPPFRINEKLLVEKKGGKAVPLFEPDLLLLLRDTRKFLASSREMEAEDIISYLKLHQLATWLPANLADLQAVAGFDDVQLKSYGVAFLKVILEYLEVNNLESRIKLKRKS